MGEKLNKPLVIYHGSCRDGFGAAWVVWRRHPHAEFVPAYYGQNPPDVKDRDVFVIDFCYDRETMIKMKNEAKSLVLLDHHKTAQEAMAGLDWPVFDMARSGAGMAWDYFFPNQERPWLINYIEDRDIWAHKLPNGPAVNAFISTLRYDFETWYKATRLSLDEVVRNGQIVEDKIRSIVLTLAEENTRMVEFEGYQIPCVNAHQIEISELLNYLADGQPFSLGWFQRKDGLFIYCLRSKGDFDVSAIAKKYGGGGHKNAAGFQCKEMLKL